MKERSVAVCVACLLISQSACNQTALASTATQPALTPTRREYPTTTPSPTDDPAWLTLVATARAGWTIITSTLEAAGAVCDEGDRLLHPDLSYRFPTARGTVFTCAPVGDEGQNAYTKVLLHDPPREWIIDHTLLPSFPRHPWSLMVPWRWTDDGRYLYFFPQAFPGGDDCIECYFHDHAMLLRIDLQSGNTETIVPFRSETTTFALSPNDRYLAFSYSSDAGTFHLRDMDSGLDRSLNAGAALVATGAFVWTPDNRKLVFAAASSGWNEGTGGISIFALTRTNMHLQLIHRSDPRLLLPFPGYYSDSYWSDTDLLNLLPLADTSEPFWSDWAIHIQTGVITVATPTPWP